MTPYVVSGLDGVTVVVDHELRQRIAGAATSTAAALRAARGLERSDTAGGRDEALQTLLALLEKACDDLHAAQARQPASYEETLFPTAAMAFAAIEELTNGQALGFIIRRDGMGRCRVRLWQVPRV
jgi:hypothetical protein